MIQNEHIERLFVASRLVCNGKPIKIPKSVEGIMIVSTPSYGGGSDLWDEKRSAPLRTRLRHMQTECSPAAIDDGKLEVVGVVSNTLKP